MDLDRFERVVKLLTGTGGPLILVALFMWGAYDLGGRMIDSFDKMITTVFEPIAVSVQAEVDHDRQHGREVIEQLREQTRLMQRIETIRQDESRRPLIDTPP